MGAGGGAKGMILMAALVVIYKLELIPITSPVRFISKCLILLKALCNFQ